MRPLPLLIAMLALACPRPGQAAPEKLASSQYAMVMGEKGEARLGGYLTGLIDAVAPRAAQVVGLDTVAPVRVVLYRSGPRHRSDVVTPVGTASYPDGTIRLDVSLLEIRQLPGIVSHEVAHVMTMRAAAPRYQALPRWFSEGVAGYAEGRDRRQADAGAQRAERSGIEAPLAALDEEFLHSYAVDPGQRHTVYAYAKSTSVVYFLVDRFGKGVIAKLLAATRRQGDFSEALKEVTGLRLPDLEAAWRASLRRTPITWIALLDPNLLMWAVMALLLLVAVVRFWIVRRRAAAPEEEATRSEERRPLGW